jgi:hypothetical protein
MSHAKKKQKVGPHEEEQHPEPEFFEIKLTLEQVTKHSDEADEFFVEDFKTPMTFEATKRLLEFLKEVGKEGKQTLTDSQNLLGFVGNFGEDLDDDDHVRQFVWDIFLKVLHILQNTEQVEEHMSHVWEESAATLAHSSKFQELRGAVYKTWKSAIPHRNCAKAFSKSKLLVSGATSIRNPDEIQRFKRLPNAFELFFFLLLNMRNVEECVQSVSSHTSSFPGTTSAKPEDWDFMWKVNGGGTDFARARSYATWPNDRLSAKRCRNMVDSYFWYPKTEDRVFRLLHFNEEEEQEQNQVGILVDSENGHSLDMWGSTWSKTTRAQNFS